MTPALPPFARRRPPGRSRALARGLRVTAFALGLVGLAAVARGELLEVRQIAGGMECAECARTLRLEAGRLDGAVATEASWNRRILTVHFRAGSHATLEELRAVVRRHHFTVGEAEIVVKGRVARAPSGALQLLVEGPGAAYEIAAASSPSGSALSERLARQASEPAGAPVTLRGRITGDLATPSVSGTRLWVLEILTADPSP